MKYHLLSTMLLNELQKEHERVEGLVAEVHELRTHDAELAARVAALELRE